MKKQRASRWPKKAICKYVATFAFLFFSIAGPASAQEFPPAASSSVLVNTGSGSPMDIVKTHDSAPEQGTHPLIRLTPDKSEIIRLPEPVQSLLVGNPSHLNVLMDSARTLVLVPREPGATHFTALNRDGEIIMQRHVIVGSPKEDYVRIRRSCINAGGGDCETTSVYYCPGMCHPVGIMNADQGQPSVSAAASGASNVAIEPPASIIQGAQDEEQESDSDE